MRTPPQISPPKSGGKDSMMNHDSTLSGAISTPLARTESPIQAPSSPIGGISTAEAKAPVRAAAASLAAANDCMYICVVKTPTIIEAR